MLDSMSQQAKLSKTFFAFEDRMLDLCLSDGPAQHYFIAETGSGKSRAIIEFVKQYGQELRLAIVLNSAEEVNARYRELEGLKNVRLWLSDEGNIYDKSDLKTAQIAIVTHQFFITASNRNFLGPRDAIIVDETPIWKKVQDFTAQHLDDARERSLADRDHLQPAVNAYAWLTTEKPVRKYLPFTEADYPEVFAGLKVLVDDREGGVKRVLEAAEAGRAMLYTDSYGNSKNSPVVILYPLSNPLKDDKVMIVSATAHMEGGQLRKDPPRPNIEGNFRNVEFVKCEWPDITKNVRSATTDKQDVMFDPVEQILRNEVQGDTLIVGYKRWTPEFLERLKHKFESFEGNAFTVRSHEIHLLHHGKGIGSNDFRECKEVIIVDLNNIPQAADLAEVFYHTGDKITAQSLQEAQQRDGKLDQLRQGKKDAELKQMVARGCCRTSSEEGVASPMRAWLIVPSDQLRNTDLNELFPNCQEKLPPKSLSYSKKEPYRVETRLLQILEETKADKLTRSEVDRLYCEKFRVSSPVINKNARDIPSWLKGSSWRFVTGKRGKGGEAYFERNK